MTHIALLTPADRLDVRDLGGHRTADSRSVRRQHLFVAGPDAELGEIVPIDVSGEDVASALEAVALVGTAPVAFRVMPADRMDVTGALLGALGVPGHEMPPGLDLAYVTRLRTLFVL